MSSIAAPTLSPLDHSSPPAGDKIRVLVVDDSVIFRKIVRDALSALPNVEVVGSAANGRIAIEKIEQYSPDLITLDFEMPELDGPGVLRWLRASRRPTKAVMLSALTVEGGEATLEALQEGAFDFVVKPSGADAQANLLELQTALQHRVDAVHTLLAGKRSQRPAARTISAPVPPPISSRSPTTPKRPQPGLHRIGIVGIGVSTGGPDALRIMLPQLPADLPVPVVVVQHMPPVFTRSLADSLNKLCQLRVSEGADGQIIRPGEIVIAPGGRQMKVHKLSMGQARVELTDDPPVQSCRPSVDYLFASLAEAYGGQVLSVIMTGMGYDGADGCRRLHALGGPVIAQDEASCVVFGMPRKPVEEGIADVVAPLGSLAAEVVRYAGRRAHA
ncbi:MAG: chemotaxis response regulator protein-glutamate methylesterase [Planctomycetaceae bacterium]|nr:chemotaxis response regulator protein-glutamate methylesterase [Planctomycetaceae bacterium]